MNMPISSIMDGFLNAVITARDADQIEDAVSAWRDMTVNSDEHDRELVDTVADVVMDAVRQLGERIEKRSAIRISKPDGTRLTFSWRADDEDPSPLFNQSILGAVKRALNAEVGENGIDAIAAERQRQIDEEGWSADHDDKHTAGELAGAASAYAMSASAGLLTNGQVKIANPPPFFKYGEKWWKPKDPRSDLVRAGALIAAEIDRIDRGARKDGR